MNFLIPYKSFLDKVALPFLTRFLDEALLTGGQKPTSILKVANATLALMNIVYNCDYLPESLHEILPNYFENLIKAQRSSLTALLTDPKYQHKEGKEEAKQKVEHVLKTSEELRRGAVESGRVSELHQNPKYQKLHSQIQEYDKLLQSYLSSSSTPR